MLEAISCLWIQQSLNCKGALVSLPALVLCESEYSGTGAWRWCYRTPLIDPPHISELMFILQPFLNQTQKFKSTSFVPMLYRDVNLFLCSLKSYQIPSYQSIGKGPMLMLLVHVIKANNHFIGVVGHKLTSPEYTIWS